ncbi:MAG: HAMP domain-containing histidine kinase [Anaerolineae bacterium]|nr:HAMP domain-containing histidine kinase [Anaerolineae bacterium]
MNTELLPGERARRESARWVLWSYTGLTLLGFALHIVRSISRHKDLNAVYLISTAMIGVAAVVSLTQLKHSLSRAMLLFAWITFVFLSVLLAHEIITGQDYVYLFTMFYVGIFTLGIILGYKDSLHYMIATGMVFLVLGAIYLNIWHNMIVPIIVSYGFTVPAKVVERLIAQSTQDLERLNHRLEDQVAERTAELVESNQHLRSEVSDRMHMEEVLRHRTVELESRNEELNAYAHTVAHDIKAPLASIIGFGELLERHHTEFTNDQLTYYFGIIARNGRKITNIVDELLLLSSVREAEVVDVGPLDMATIVDEAQQRLLHEIAEKKAEIVLPEAWPVAFGQASWVEEIWTNYISNAIKYGGAPPHIELGYTTLEAGSSELDPASSIQHPVFSIRFWVRDNGPGLAPEEQARLFTPFTRLDQARAKGYGLGLSIVRRIAERLGGEVGVESVVGQGSTFFFILPAAPEHTQRVRTSGDAGDRPGETS